MLLALAAKALSATSNLEIVPYEEYTTNKSDSSINFIEYNYWTFQNYNLVSGPVHSNPNAEKGILCVKTMTNKKTYLEFLPSDSVYSLKMKFQDKEGYPPDQQRYVFKGILLDNGSILSHVNVQHQSTINVVLIPNRTTYHLTNNFFDPKYSYDLTNIKDNGVNLMRGKCKYLPPYGWKRIAINVLNKYGENNWLGPEGDRQNSDDNEWPVSYHGKAKRNSKSMAEDGLTKDRPLEITYGIYSTPDINLAALYATQFQSGGNRYKIMFQNRVNPATLVKVSKKVPGVVGDSEYWISPSPTDVRPYGICIKLIKS